MKKKIFAVFILLFLLICSSACSPGLPSEEIAAPSESISPAYSPAVQSASPQPENTPAPIQTVPNQTAISEHTMKAFSGEHLDDHELLLTIAAYKSACTPILLGESSTVKIAFDTPIADYRISRLSYIDGDYGELLQYIDLFVDSHYDAASNTLEIDCSWAKEDRSSSSSKYLWSILLKTTSETGESIWYYTRFDPHN